jgi:hypothetical protein
LGECGQLGGELGDRKGINRQGGGLSVRALTDKDREDIHLASRLDCDYMAISFPKDAEDVREARELLHQAGGEAGIVAKIERREAVDNLASIMQAADAVMIGTEVVLSEVQNQQGRERLRGFLDREEVQTEMVARGIDPREAQTRVDSLTDAEVAYLVDKLDQLPAGGNAIGPIVGALVFIFVLLLITDLLGLTNVYPFVRHRR